MQPGEQEFQDINRLHPVSRETFGLIARYAELLLLWQKRINLISDSTVEALWQRHILDSVQIFALAHDKPKWIDLGSGGGLPGLVIACLLRDTPGGHIHLIESNNKKAAFLRFVAGELSLPVTVHATRIESALPRLESCDVVTARALASLPLLIAYTNLLLKKGAVGLFPKGRGFDSELTEARKDWHFCCHLHPSSTELGAQILEVTIPDAG